jgi:hypothetical protein
MDRELRDEVIKNIIYELGGKVPDVISVFGGNYEDRNFFMKALSFEVSSIITGDIKEGSYIINLDRYFNENIG